MSKSKTIDHGREITNRFLLAMDEIVGSTRFNKITARDFGSEIGITSSNLTRLRSSKTNRVSLEAIGKLCEIYKVSPDWLITGVGTPWKINNPSLEKRMDGFEKTITDLKDRYEALNLEAKLKSTQKARLSK